MSLFEEYKNVNEADYLAYADTIDSQPYKEALFAMQTWDEYKRFSIDTVSQYKFEQFSDKDYLNVYDEFTTSIVVLQLKGFEQLINSTNEVLERSLANPALKDQEKIIVEEKKEDIENEAGELMEDFITAYNTKTEEFINLPPTPSGRFIISHASFNDQLNRITDLDELKNFWESYKSFYDTAIASLEQMLPIAQQLQTPKASSAINYYHQILSTSMNVSTHKAQSKRAQMCSTGNGWIWWIIVILILLCLLGFTVYCNGNGKGKKSGRRASL